LSDFLTNGWIALGFKPVFLWSDTLTYILFLGGGLWLIFALRQEYWRVALRQVVSNRIAMISFGVLCLYGVVGFLDTLHFRTVSLENPRGGNVESVLDVICRPLLERTEKTYSAPFATRLFSKEMIQTTGGREVRGYPRLEHAGSQLADPDQPWPDIQHRILLALGTGLGLAALVLFLLSLGRLMARSFGRNLPPFWSRHGAWLVGLVSVVAVLVSELTMLSSEYHILGTDKTGQDVFYLALKGVRTGLIIGTLTTLIVTPFAILFGILAGYLGGWVDDVIQYVYTTLASIPDILLIAAAMLIFQIGIADKETIFSADERLVYLCVIMGVTSWTGLCRLIRAEVLKLKEIEYVQAADAFGVTRLTIMLRHLAPGVMHIVLISIVLRFSGLVLAEAVLAYVGIGVDPSMQSWGNMINQARFELARDPIVWWNLMAAFLFMLGLVLPANLFGDAVRDALDPRLRTQ